MALGEGDLFLAKQGKNDDLKPTSFTARMLKNMVDFKFEPYTPDVIIKKELDLAPYGIQGKALVMPGHTPGALTILFNDAEVLRLKPHDHHDCALK